MSSLRLDWCSYDAAKYAVEHWHYSGCMPAGKLVKVGVWEVGAFVGAVIFGRGANNHMGQPYGLKQIEVAELTRIALREHQAAVSQIIAVSIRFLKRQSPGLRLVVSYADPEHGHHGGIYQAANWLYAGRTGSYPEYRIRGRRVHGRTWRSLCGSGRGKSTEKGSAKHRCLLPLDPEMRRQLLALAQPYPKRERSAAGGAAVDQTAGGGSTPTRSLEAVP